MWKGEGERRSIPATGYVRTLMWKEPGIFENQTEVLLSGEWHSMRLQQKPR
jgi:hypothetical protein